MRRRIRREERSGTFGDLGVLSWQMPSQRKSHPKHLESGSPPFLWQAWRDRRCTRKRVQQIDKRHGIARIPASSTFIRLKNKDRRKEGCINLHKQSFQRKPDRTYYMPNARNPYARMYLATSWAALEQAPLSHVQWRRRGWDLRGCRGNIALTHLHSEVISNRKRQPSWWGGLEQYIDGNHQCRTTKLWNGPMWLEMRIALHCHYKFLSVKLVSPSSHIVSICPSNYPSERVQTTHLAPIDNIDIALLKYPGNRLAACWSFSSWIIISTV